MIIKGNDTGFSQCDKLLFGGGDPVKHPKTFGLQLADAAFNNELVEQKTFPFVVNG
jgi:hypothetical protein